MKTKLLPLFCLLFFIASAGQVFAGVVDIGSAADSQVVEGYPTSNYGSQTAMYVASASGGYYKNERTWVKFDLTGQIPAGATINSAKLRMWCWKSDTADNMTANVHGSTDDAWTEAGITWNTQPSYEATALDGQVMTAKTQNYWVEWDVTGFVQTEVDDNGDMVISLVVKAAVEGQDPYRTYAFDGKEYGSSLAPRLRIEYEGDWPTTDGFKIFHMNDMHSRLLPHEFDVPDTQDTVGMEWVGGASYFTTRLLELKSASPDSLIMDAGDISEGNPIGDLRGNGGMIDFYNELDRKLKLLGGRGIDAVVVGNHDVNSAQMLNNMKNNADFPAISMNIYDAVTGTPYFPEYVTVTVNNTKVGILGYTTDSSSFLGSDLVGVVEVKKCVWEDSDADTIDVKDKVSYLRTTEGCDVVILLSHVGQSRVTAGDDALIADTGGVLPPEVVISGHWHTWTERVWQPSNMNGKTLVAEAASYMQYIGELEVTGAGKYVQAQKHVIRNSEIVPDSDMETLIAGLITEYNAQDPAPAHGIYDVIGYSAVDLTLDKDKWWTVSEYPWAATNAAGAWICDSMVWKASQLGMPVDLAMQSGGGIRRDVAAGEITYIEIYEAYPWSDDNMVRVQMTGQEIWNWIQSDYVGTSISDGWLVTAQDGLISAITYQGSPISLTGTYNVAVSEYMYDHPENALSDTTPEDMNYSIREGVVDFTAQYNTPNNPMYPDGITPRYDLNTEFAGGFKAVVTMIADSENQPYHEDAFIRFIEAMPETLARRTGYGLSELVNTDGSINMAHRFSEIMLYRSHLGFPDGLLKTGDIIEVWGEGGFYDGTPEFIDQEGIYGADQQFVIYGNDETLARAEYHGTIDSFWDEEHENHYVKFYAEKTGDSKVTDSADQEITVYQEDGYYSKTLPGNIGDILELTGVNTYEGDDGRRFRCNTAIPASSIPVTGYPSTSAVDAVAPYEQSGTSISLSATAGDVQSGSSGSGTTTVFINEIHYDNAGTDTGEAIEIAGPAGSNLTGWHIELYNGNGGASYGTIALSGTITDAGSGYGTLGFSQAGIQNGGPDGLALVDDSGSVIQFLSYEGSFTAADGPAAGMVSTNIGVSETYTTPVGYSLQLSGTGTTYEQFTWQSAAADSFGSVNTGQTFGAGSGSTGSTGEVTQVEFFYRYGLDGLTWGAWTLIGTDSTAGDGWNHSFFYPEGQGYYEFYTVSTDDDGNIEDAPIRADAEVLFNNAPEAPELEESSIADGQTDVELSPTLSVTVSDLDVSAVDVSFYDGNGNLIGTVEDVPSGETASIVWEGLSENTTYTWYAVVDDGIDSVPSPVWSFTTLTGEPVPAVGMYGLILSTLLLSGIGLVNIRQK
ncbi:DNRLRE domain-containing protein [uncultured Desulfobacter sp.]|uniref:CBM96 family carbohydrate-binding protein n=1 Tax=uncultured Desulfobacter sp. TaxID=240139 RepID=UPI002AA74BC9|nr:DNRLRE domain-containing protein [uncultured Desulfobacter sp.]